MKGLAARKVYGVLVILVGLVTLITCGKDDWITGLGSHVDTSPPVVQIITDFGTGPGSFLTGTKKIYIDASDDIGVNSVTVIYTYNYVKDGVLYPMEVAVDASWSDEDGCYTIEIDTLKGFFDEPTSTWLPMADGPFAAIVIVEDKSGKKTTTPDIIYTVKNGPPKVTIQIPKPKTTNSELLNSFVEDIAYPTVVSDSYFLGVFEDLAGVAEGYPLIKLWEAGQPEPNNFTQNAGWENVTSYNSPGAGWVRPDEGFVESSRGEKGGSFRYYLRKRQSNGNPFAESTKNGLAPDKKYNLKIKAVDVNGIVLEWPRDAYPNKPEYMTMFLDAEGIPPVVTLIEPSADKIYFKDDFNIIAEAVHQGDLSTDIFEMRFEVIGKDRKSVLLKKWTDTEITDYAQAKFLIELEKTYYCTEKNETLQSAIKIDKETDVPSGAVSQVTFIDGNYTFNITAYDDIGARKTVSFSIYIDRQPPVTTVTSVSPYYSQDPIKDSDNSNGFEKKPYRRWTVNKTVKIAVNSTDNRGDAIDLATNYTKFKYLLSPNNDITNYTFNAWKGSDPLKTFERYLYEASNARFFDDTRANPIQITSGTPNGNPLIKVEGSDGSYTLTLQTHKYDAAEKYNLWLYIVAMDNAENIAFDKILLYVDQETDNPKITFGNVNSDGTTFMDDKYNIRLTVIDDNGLSDAAGNDIPQIEYRFAKSLADRDSKAANEGWHTVYDWEVKPHAGLTEDVLSVNINDLTLKKIASNLLDLPYEAEKELSDALKNALGEEDLPKFLQIRATDSVKTKVYESDGPATSTTEWRQFTMDLTYPEIFVSVNDLSGGIISRDAGNPFGIPQKNMAYNELDHFYGDIIEENLKSISVKIDGDNDSTIIYTIGIPEEGKDHKKYSQINPGKPHPIVPDQFYVWENGKNAAGKTILRWYIPKTGFPSMEDGPHTFEISFEDKVPQSKTMSLTFYKDTQGPTISFVNPGFVIYLSETDSLNDALNSGNPTPAQQGIYEALKNTLIKDMSVNLSGTFNDDYSPIAGDTNNSFWWKIDNYEWKEETITDLGSKSVKWEIPLTSLPADKRDGVHLLSIRVKDSLGNGYAGGTTPSGNSGKGYENNFAFMIDQSVPELKITEEPKKALNSQFEIKGRVEKTYGVKRLSVKLGEEEIAFIENALAPEQNITYISAYAKEIKVEKGGGKTFNFTAKIDPSGLDKDGPASLSFNVIGSSGQAAMTTSSFTYDTKGPSIAIGAPITSSIYVSNADWNVLKPAVDNDNFASAGSVESIYTALFNARIKDNAASFAVTFTDEYSNVFETDKSTYWYRFDNDTDWTPVTITDPQLLGEKSVSVKLPLPAGGKWTDTIHRVSIRLTDSLGNGFSKSNGDTAPVTESGEGYRNNTTFMIDTGVPQISGIASDLGTHNSTFIINGGKIVNTFDIQELSVKIGSDVVANLKGENGAAVISYTRPANSKKTFNITSVTIDPSKAVAMDGTKDGSYSVSVTVKGSSEQSAMNVSNFILDTQGPKISINSPIKEKTYITSTADLDTIKNAITNNSIASISDPLLKNKFFNMLKNNIKDVSTGLSGSFEDTYSNVNAQFWYKFDNNSEWETGTATPNANNPKSAEWKIDLPSMEDGLHRLSIRVKDALDNGYDKNTPDAVISALSADKKNSDSGHETNLTFILDTKAPALVTSGIIEGEVKGPSNDGYFTVSGQITGTYLVKRLSASIQLPAAAIVETGEDGVIKTPTYGDSKISEITLAPVTGSEKTYSYSFRVNTSGLSYGSLTVTVNAIGSSDQSDLKTLPFIFDNKGPSITVSVPGNKIILSDVDKDSYNTALEKGTLTTAQQTNIKNILITDKSVKLSGTISDEYSPVSGNYWWSIDGGAWQEETIAVSDSKSVGWEVPLTAVKDGAQLDDGVHLLSIRATDKWGNGSDGNAPGADGHETNIAFMIDSSTPELEITKAPTKALNGQFTIEGKVKNTYGVKRLSVKLGNLDIAVKEEGLSTGQFPINNGIIYGKGISVITTPNDGRSFTFTATIDPVSVSTNANGLKDGPASLTFNAIGSSGQAAMITSSFTLDTTGPSIAIGAPLSSNIYVTDGEWTILEPAVRLDKFAPITGDLETIYDKVFDARIKDNKASFAVTITDEASSVFESDRKTYWYKFDDDALWTTGTADPADYGKMTASVRLTLPENTVWSDSVHRVSIRVTDSLGNGYDKDSYGVPEKNSGAGYQSNLIFMIDSGTPVLTVNNDKTDLGIFKPSQSLSVSGTITGTYKVQELKAKIGTYEKSIALSSILPRDSESRRSYKFDVPITNTTLDNAIGHNEGSYTISLTAKGSSELSDTKMSSFILDTKGPAISVNSPISKKIYLTSGSSDSERALIEDAIKNNFIDGLNTGVKSKYYDLLRYNVKDIETGLSGSFADTYSDIGAKFWYKFNDGGWQEGDTIPNAGNSKSADWKIALTELKEGLNSLSIRVQDELENGYNDQSTDVPDISGGNGYESNLTFIIDTSTPKFGAITGLADGDEPSVMGPKGPSNYDYFPVTGRISDTYMLKRLSVSVGEGSTVILVTDGNPAPLPGNTGDPFINGLTISPVKDEARTFSYTFNVFTKNLANKELQYGSRTITINAVGSSDQSTIKTLSFIYDNKGPNISFSVPNDKYIMTEKDKNDLNSVLNNGGQLNSLQTAYDKLKTMLITDTAAKLSGTISDEYSTLGSTFWWSIDGGAFQDGTLSAENSKSAGWEVPLTNLSDGVHLLSIRAEDKLGNGSNKTTQGNESFENNIAFMIDKSVPEMEIITAPDKAINDVFPIIGQITKTYGVKRLSVKLGNEEIAYIEEGKDGVYQSHANGITLVPTQNIGKTFDFEVMINPTGKSLLTGSTLEDGPISLTFNAIGSSGNTVMKTSSFILDTKGPAIVIGAPISNSVYVTDAQWNTLKTAFAGDNFSSVTGGLKTIFDDVFEARIKDRNASFTVTFNDDASPVFMGSQNNKYWYKFDDDDWEDVTVPESNNKSVRVNLPLPTAKRTNGIHRLSIRVKDSLGNGYNDKSNNVPATESGEGYQSNLVFMIDSGAPKLAVDNTNLGIINKNGSLDIGGTIEGTYGIQEMSLKIGSVDDITIPSNKISSVSATKYEFTGVNIPKETIAAATGGKEGSYTVSVNVKGSSDLSDMKVCTFILDTMGPAISVNSPIKEKIYLESTAYTSINNAIAANNIASLDGAVKADYYKLLKYNVKDVSAGISGSFADTYSSIKSKYYYKINDSGWLEGNADVNANNPKSAEWKIALTSDDGKIKLPNGYVLTEGLNRLSIHVQDVLDNGYDILSNPPDNSGNGYETNLTFILDTKSPVVYTSADFIEGDVKGPEASGYFVVEGTIKETFMVKKFSVMILGPLNTNVETEITTNGTLNTTNNNGDPTVSNLTINSIDGNTNAYSYSFRVNTNVLLTSGSRSITINAVGSSDQSTVKILPFIYDNEGPKIAVNMPIKEKVYLSDAEWAQIKSGSTNGAVNDKITKLAAMGIKDAASGLNGYFNDVYSNIGSSFWYQFPDDVNLVWNEVVITGNDKSVAWTIPLTNTDPNVLSKLRKDGIYRLNIRVKDTLGNGSDKDNLGKDGYETNLAFMIDMGIPVFSDFGMRKKDGAVLPSSNVFLNGDFEIFGTITDVVGVELAVKVGNINIPVPSGAIYESDTINKIHKFRIPVSVSGFQEMAYSLSVTATATSGQAAIAMRNFTYDITPPSVQINDPAVGSRKPGGEGVSYGDLANQIGKYSIWQQGSWVTGVVRIGGVADDENGLYKIYYHLGKLGEDALDLAGKEAIYNNPDNWTDTLLDTASPVNSYWKGGLFYWNYTQDMNGYQDSDNLIEKPYPEENQFHLPFYVKVEDKAGNINIVQYKIYVDPDADIPSASIASPSNGVRVGGEIRISGTATDNNWVHSVDIRIRDTTKSPGTQGYYYKNPEDDWINETTGEIDNDNGWKTGWVKAHIVGNTAENVSWFYNVNADGLLNPAAGQLERHVEVEVRAWDTKDIMHEIFDKKSGPSETFNYYFDSGVPTISIPKISKLDNTNIPDRDYTDGIRVSGKFKLSADIQDDGGISSIRVRRTGNSTFKEIFKDGVINTGNMETGWKVIVPAIINQNNWESGWRYYLTDTGTMNQADWNGVDLDYTTQKTYAAGSMIKYTGSSTNKNAKAIKADVGDRAITGVVVDSDPNSLKWNSQFFKYSVEFEIDSTTFSNLGYGKTGIFTLELDVYDNNKQPAPYNTRGTFNMGVDNYYPTIDITTQYNAATKNFYVMGTAKDNDLQSGAIQGLERVLVYFEKNGVYYNPRGKKVADTDTYYSTSPGNIYSGEWANIPAMSSWPNVRDYGSNKTLAGYTYNVANFTNFPLLKVRAKGGNIGDVWESPHAMVIDSQELGEDTDKDGTVAEMWDGRVDKTWQAKLDTTLLPDGPITVHYIVMDQAGNASHYTDKIYIGNNRPLIREISLGTDFNKNGNITDPGEFSAPISIGDVVINNVERTTNFRVRNSRFGLKLNALYGNTQKHYRVSYVERGTLVKSTEMKRGNVYTIASTDDTAEGEGAGNTDWTKYGALSNNPGTTFVASGPAREKNDQDKDTTGYAWQYIEYRDNTNANKTGSFNANNTLGSAVDSDGKLLYSDTVDTGVFDTANFNDARMSDTATKKYNPDGSMILMHDKRFIVKVYDSTVPAGAGITEDDQLAHVALINVDFDNSDGQAPLIAINPFYWNKADDNSLYENSRKNGHIELPADLPSSFNGTNGINDRDPKVSGKVSFRGTAYDNILIDKIYFAISKHGTAGYGVTGATVAGSTYYPVASFSGNNLNGDTTRFSGNGWKFTVVSQTLNQDGHSIEWQLDYDSSFVTNVVNDDVNLTVVAQDSKSGTPNTSGTQSYRFDVVPYITNIVTTLSGAYGPEPSAFNRSALGRYPVRSGETITIQGFNLVAPNTTTGLVNGTQVAVGSVNITTTASNGSSIARATATDSTTVNDINVTIGTNIDSGNLAIRVGNTISSLNNTNSNTINNSSVVYNNEPNGVNNNILNDDRYLYVWNTGYLMNQYAGLVKNPFFRMGVDGKRYMTFGTYDTSGRWRVLVDNTYAGTSAVGTPSMGHIENLNNRYLNLTISVDQAGSWYAGASNQTSTGANADINYTFFARTAAAATTNSEGGANKRRILSMNNNGVVNENRVKTPRIYAYNTNGNTQNNNGFTGGTTGTDGNATRIFMSYYDSNSSDNPVVFRYGTVGANDHFGGDLGYASGTNRNENGGGTSAWGSFGGTTTTTMNGYRQIVADNTTTYRGSDYTAVGGLSNGRPVIAWYDNNGQRLVFSYGDLNTTMSTQYDNASARVTTATNTWQANARVVDTFKGTHVDMAVDGSNNVHLAYYDVGNGGLYYAYIPSGDVASRTAAIQKVRVDTFLAVGTKLMINVRRETINGVTREVPYISYYHGSFSETKNSIRVAWRKDFTADPVTGGIRPGTNSDDSFTGAWEVMTIPAREVPLTGEFICNGVPNPGSAQGSWTDPDLTGGNTDNGLTALSRGSVDLRKSVVVGYMTNKYYEGAMLKGSTSD